MSTIHNEEIRAMRQTLTLLKQAIPLEPNQTKKEKMKRDVKELEELIHMKLLETNDFVDIRLEEDIY